MADVYINKIASFFPNDAVSNDEMEEYLGYIGGEKSKSKRIVLRSNGIEQRYYALKKGGEVTHSYAELTAMAIKKLFDSGDDLKNIELLACGDRKSVV